MMCLAKLLESSMFRKACRPCSWPAACTATWDGAACCASQTQACKLLTQCCVPACKFGGGRTVRKTFWVQSGAEQLYLIAEVSWTCRIAMLALYSMHFILLCWQKKSACVSFGRMLQASTHHAIFEVLDASAEVTWSGCTVIDCRSFRMLLHFHQHRCNVIHSGAATLPLLASESVQHGCRGPSHGPAASPRQFDV